MRLAEQVRADIAEKVKVTGPHRNPTPQGFYQAAGRFSDRPAKVAQDGAGGTELRRDLFELRLNGLGPFGGNLPGPQDPTAPAGQGDQQRAAAFFAGRVDVQRPAAIGGQRRPQGRSRVPVQGFQVNQKALAEFADLATGEMDAVFLGQRRADLLALAMDHQPFDAHLDEQVVAYGALGRNQFG